MEKLTKYIGQYFIYAECGTCLFCFQTLIQKILSTIKLNEKRYISYVILPMVCHTHVLLDNFIFLEAKTKLAA